MSTTVALTWMGVLGSVGVATDAAAGLHTREAMSERGIFSPGLLRTGWRRWLYGRLSRPLSWLFGYPQVLMLFVAQLVGVSALLTVPWLSGWSQAAAGAFGATFAFEQANQQRVLVHVVTAFPSRRVDAWPSAQCRHAQASIFGQRQSHALHVQTAAGEPIPFPGPNTVQTPNGPVEIGLQETHALGFGVHSGFACWIEEF